jgi:proteasome accessory factor C
VQLRVGRSARWITEYYPCEEVSREHDHWLVSLRAADLGWARRLVLGLGPEVAVVAPPELVAVVGGEARAALDAYAADNAANDTASDTASDTALPASDAPVH